MWGHRAPARWVDLSAIDVNMTGGRERGQAWPPGVAVLMSVTNQWREAPRYAAVVPPDLKGGEKRLVFAALMETCTT